MALVAQLRRSTPRQRAGRKSPARAVRVPILRCLIGLASGLTLAAPVTSCSDNSPTQPTSILTSPDTALMLCPASIQRQSVDALPVQVTWPLPTVAGIPVDKGSYAPAPGTSFPIGTSTVTFTADNTSLGGSCSFIVTITPPDPKLLFTRFMAFGDSITEGFVGNAFLPAGVSPRDIPALLRAARGRPIPGISQAVQPLNSYPAQLQNLLTPTYHAQIIVIANEGRSGERASEGASRVVSSLLSTQPEVVMLLEGFNDIDAALADRPLGVTTPIDVSPIADELRSIVERVQEHGAAVLLATLTPVTSVREQTDPGTQAAITALNSEIRGMSGLAGVSGVVDLHAMLDGIPGIIGSDGFHPTVAGYRRIAEIFFADIVSRYDVTPRAPTFTTAH